MTNFIKSPYNAGQYLRSDIAAKMFTISIVLEIELDNWEAGSNKSHPEILVHAPTVTEALEIAKAAIEAESITTHCHHVLGRTPVIYGETVVAETVASITITDRDGKLVLMRQAGANGWTVPPTTEAERNAMENEIQRLMGDMDHNRQADNRFTLASNWERIEFLEAMLQCSPIVQSQTFKGELEQAKEPAPF